MAKDFVILHPIPDLIVIQHSVARARLQLLVSVAVMVFWYGFLIDRAEKFVPLSIDTKIGHLLIMLLPLIYIVQFVRLVRTSIVGRTFELNGLTKSVLLNGREITPFECVQRIRIRTLPRDSESEARYQLSLVLEDRSKVLLAESADKALIHDAGHDVADLLGREIFLV